MINDDWDSVSKATPPETLNAAQTTQPKRQRPIVPDNLVLDNSFTPENNPQTEEETHIIHSAQSDWDSVSGDTPTDSKTDDWDAVSAPAPHIDRKQQTHQPESRTGRPPTKRGGLKGSSIAIIALCIAVVGLSAFSALNIFHVVNFNIANFSVPAPQAQGFTSGQIEATNIVISADASATALTSLEQAQLTPTAQQIYNQATSGTPAMDNALTDNRNGWDQFVMDWGGECTFVNAVTYHIIIPNLGHSLLCTSHVLSYFNNFALQISITPVQGDFAALVFGQNPNGYYSTDIHTDGEYALFDSVNSKFLTQGSSSAIKQGLNQTNVITLIMNNNQFYFYANGQLLTSNYLSNYVAGSIDVAAVSRTQAPVDIAFSNLKIWKL